MTIIVSGFSPDDAVPGSYRASVFGAGLISIGSLPVKVACLGTMGSSGSAVADVDVVGPIVTEDEADGYFGTGSELATMVYAALSAGEVNVYGAPTTGPTAATGGTGVTGGIAATVTVVMSGTPSRNGTVYGRIGGKPFNFSVAASEANGTTASAMDSAVDSMIRAQATSGVNSATVTLTARDVGTRGNQLVFWWDSSDVPGLVMTVTGGTAIHSGSMVPFSGGTGTDSVGPQLTNLEGDTYDFIVPAANDTTNMGLVKAHLTSEAMPAVSHLEQAVFAIGAGYSAAASLGNTTLNAQRCTLVWCKNGENSVAWLAAKVAGMRASVVAGSPNHKWGLTPECTLVGAQPQLKQDNPGHAEQKNALNNGLTVLRTEGADLVIVRGITTKCLTSSSPDFRTRDWTDVDVTDRINREVGALWTDVTTANMWAEPNSPTGAQPPAGCITPATWNAKLLAMMKGFEADNWVYQVDTYPPASEWSTVRKCIMSAIPVYVKPKSFQLGANVNQTAA
jgi:phage tail sheath gpL-like